MVARLPALLAAAAVFAAAALAAPQAPPDLLKLEGSYDAARSPGCEPAGSRVSSEDPFVVTTYHGLYSVSADPESATVTVLRHSSRSGSPETIRESTANVLWRAWSEDEHLSCRCGPASADGTFPCTCEIATSAEPHTVTVLGVDSSVPGTETTREVRGLLEPLSDGALALTIEGRRCVLRRE